MGYGYLYRAVNKALQPQKKANNKLQVYLVVNGQQAGPFTKTELVQLVKNGTLKAETLVWENGMPNWVPATQVSHVNALIVLHSKGERGKVIGERTKEEGKDIINALKELGYKGKEVNEKVTALLKERPDISESEAIKEMLKRL